MRKRFCVPMIALCVLLCGCGGHGDEVDAAELLRQKYAAAVGCTMEAEVTCSGKENVPDFTLRCQEQADGSSVVEVLAPETAAGIRAVVDSGTMMLEYQDLCLPVGGIGDPGIAPATCLPRMMDALREGWLLEQNREKLGDVSCLRLCLDRTVETGGKLIFTFWLREEDGAPLLGEIAAGEEIILQARFTDFTFGDILMNQT